MGILDSFFGFNENARATTATVGFLGNSATVKWSFKSISPDALAFGESYWSRWILNNRQFGDSMAQCRQAMSQMHDRQRGRGEPETYMGESVDPEDFLKIVDDVIPEHSNLIRSHVALWGMGGLPATIAYERAFLVISYYIETLNSFQKLSDRVANLREAVNVVSNQFRVLEENQLRVREGKTYVLSLNGRLLPVAFHLNPELQLSDRMDSVRSVSLYRTPDGRTAVRTDDSKVDKQRNLDYRHSELIAMLDDLYRDFDPALLCFVSFWLDGVHSFLDRPQASGGPYTGPGIAAQSFFHAFSVS